MVDDGTRGDARQRDGEAMDRRRGRARINVLSWEVGRQRQSLPLMVQRAMAFSAAPEFDEELVAAVGEFYGLTMDVTTAETEILEDPDERIRFFPWFLWDWRATPTSPTVGERFLEVDVLAPHERRTVEALCASYVGFYEALGDADGAGVDVRDMVTGETIHVDDEGLSGELFAGQILQARLVRVDTRDRPCTLVDAVYAIVPAAGRAAVEAELRSLPAEVGDGVARLELYACEMIEAAEQILEALARPPVVTNADGERMVLARGVWQGDGARAVSRAVEGVPIEGVAAAGEADGALWLWRVEGRPRGFVRRLAADRIEVGAAGPDRLDELLDLLASCADTDAPAVRSLTDFPIAAEAWIRRGAPEPWLDALPELRQGIRHWLERWGADWLDVPWAELGDRPPRDAIHLSDGRRRLDAALRRIARLQGSEREPIDVAGARAELGL